VLLDEAREREGFSITRENAKKREIGIRAVAVTFFMKTLQVELLMLRSHSKVL